MKIEVGNQVPEEFKESWPGQYTVFSHYEFACGIPQILFAISTVKENGKPNLCFHSWSCFQGDEGGYFAILAGILQSSHTYQNIKRKGEFCVNFLSQKQFDQMMETIKNNEAELDEFEAGGFTVEDSTSISVPRIKESFLTLECKCKEIKDLSRAGISAMIIGRVANIAIEEDFANGIDKKYSEDGFMFNVHSPRNHFTNQEDPVGVASVKIERTL